MKDTVIHIVDDDEPFRTAVSRVLRTAGYCVQTYSNAGDFLIADKPAQAGCVLLDVQMPGPNGLELQEALKRHDQPLPIIFVTGFADVSTSVRAMKAGAVDFLTKPIERKLLLEAVRTAVERDLLNRARNEKVRHVRTRFDTLTYREKEVFSAVVSGKLNKQIAADLGTAERTVKAHRAHLMEKMQANSLAELVHLADLLGPRQPNASVPAFA